MNMQTLPRPEDIEAALGASPRARRRRWTRRVVLVAVLALAAGGGASWYMGRGAAPEVTTYETTEAVRMPITVTVTATGTIAPTNQVEVSSELSGIVRMVAVAANSTVKRGDVLAELDTAAIAADVARAEAQVAAAEARLAVAETTSEESKVSLGRQQTLRQRNLNAKQELDTASAASARAEAQVKAAEADVAVARAELEIKRADLGKAKVVSPIDGVVLARDVDPGQMVASSFQAPTLFKIAEDLTRMQLEAQVDEADVGAVREGQKASFSVDAYPGRKFPATIASIEFAPQTKDGVVTYKAVLAIDNSELLLRPGMTATAEIVIKDVADAIAVPNAALRYVPPKPKAEESFSLTRLFMPRMPRAERASGNSEAGKSLWVLKDGTAEKRIIEAGVTDGRMTEVTKGLAAGEAVILSVRKAGP